MALLGAILLGCLLGLQGTWHFGATNYSFWGLLEGWLLCSHDSCGSESVGRDHLNALFFHGNDERKGRSMLERLSLSAQRVVSEEEDALLSLGRTWWDAGSRLQSSRASPFSFHRGLDIHSHNMPEPIAIHEGINVNCRALTTRNINTADHSDAK
jgi:hypothetical protein